MAVRRLTYLVHERERWPARALSASSTRDVTADTS